MPKAKLPRIDFRWTPNLAYVVGLITTEREHKLGIGNRARVVKGGVVSMSQAKL